MVGASKDLEQAILFRTVQHHLGSLTGEPTTHKKTTHLDSLLTACIDSATLISIKRDGLDTRKFESALLALVEQGMDDMVRDFQSLLQDQTWQNQHNIDAKLAATQASDLQGADPQNMDVCMNRMNDLRTIHKDDEKICQIRQFLRRLAETFEMKAVLQAPEAAEHRAWCFCYVLHLMCEVGSVGSRLFGDWEVGLLNQTIPGAGKTATYKRPRPDIEHEIERLGIQTDGQHSSIELPAEEDQDGERKEEQELRTKTQDVKSKTGGDMEGGGLLQRTKSARRRTVDIGRLFPKLDDSSRLKKLKDAVEDSAVGKGVKRLSKHLPNW